MKKVIITISEHYLENLQAVADMLKADGLHIKRMHDFGVITGEIEETHLTAIIKHKEVVSCQEDRQTNIPPPDADIQ